MRLSQLLECAEYAKADSTLLQNHRGTVDVKLKQQLDEINELLAFELNDPEFNDRLHNEKEQIIEALKVYEVAE